MLFVDSIYPRLNVAPRFHMREGAGSPWWSPSHLAGLLLAATCLCLLDSATAEAHEFWLTGGVDSEDGRMHIEARVGEGLHGEPVRFSAFHVERLVHAEGSEPIDLKQQAEHGTRSFGCLSNDASGVVVYQSRFSSHELAVSDFRDYLETDGLESVIPSLESWSEGRPVRERYRRVAALWLGGENWGRGATAPESNPLDVGSERTSTQNANRSGPERSVLEPGVLPVEVVPTTDPSEPANTSVAFQVIASGHVQSDVLVRAWCRPSEPGEDWTEGELETPLWRGRTDLDGFVEIPVDRAGEWMISAVVIEKSSSPNSDWDSNWGSLTFFRE